MKLCILCFSFLRKNLFPILITVMMLTVSMFVLTTFIGEYCYMSYTRDVLAKSKLQNGVYFMLPSEGNPEHDKELSLQIRENLKNFDAYSYVLTNTAFVTNNESDFCNVYLYDRAMREKFCLEVNQGRWLSEDPVQTEAVIGGVTWANVRVGDTISLENGITARVVGIMGDDVIYPSFTAYSNYKPTADIMFSVNDTIVFLSKETVDPALYLDQPSLREDSNFYVVYDDYADQQDILQVEQYLIQYGSITDYETLLENSEHSIREWVISAFPLPLFLIAVATISVICICTVVVKRSMADHSKYFLIGCSKRKGFFAIVAPLTAMFSIPCVLNVISILWMPNVLRAGDRSALVNYIIRPTAVLPILVYGLLVLAVLYLIPWLFYRRYTPITFYRRNL